MVTDRLTTSPYPTQPAEIDHVSLRDLADGYHTHSLRLVEHHHGLGDPLTTGQVAAHTLAYQHALDHRVLCSRWVTVRQALRAGTSLTEVARATDLEPEEVGTGLRSWAATQHRFGHNHRRRARRGAHAGHRRYPMSTEPMTEDQRLAAEAAAAEVRNWQTHPDVVALRVERIRTRVDRLMWAGIALGLLFTTGDDSPSRSFFRRMTCCVGAVLICR